MSETQAAPDRATSAGVYSAALGGHDSHPADRAVMARLLEISPELARIARGNRDYLGAAVLLAVAHLDIRQFIDLGTGWPSPGGVIESALAAAGDTRVAAVDIDPDIADPRYAVPLDGRARMILADLTEPEQVTGHPAMRGFIDFGQPVMVVAGCCLHYWPPGVSAGIVARYAERLAAGSAVAVTVAACPDPCRHAAMRDVWQAATGCGFGRYGDEDVKALFGGLDVLNPGAGPVRGLRDAQDRRAYLAGGIGVKR